jgi:hypothetical protein
MSICHIGVPSLFGDNSPEHTFTAVRKSNGELEMAASYSIVQTYCWTIA